MVSPDCVWRRWGVALLGLVLTEGNSERAADGGSITTQMVRDGWQRSAQGRQADHLDGVALRRGRDRVAAGCHSDEAGARRSRASLILYSLCEPCCRG